MTRRWSAAACIATVLIAGSAMAGDVVILDSSAPALGVGDVVDDARPVIIPAGATVSMIMADGETRIVDGPYKGPLASAVSEGSGAAAALTSSRGGDTKVLGAVRAPQWEIAD